MESLYRQVKKKRFNSVSKLVKETVPTRTKETDKDALSLAIPTRNTKDNSEITCETEIISKKENLAINKKRQVDILLFETLPVNKKGKFSETVENTNTQESNTCLNRTSDFTKVNKKTEKKEKLEEELHDPTAHIKANPLINNITKMLLKKPAYQRYNHLIQKQFKNPLENLPCHLRLLKEEFYALETVVNFLRSRGDSAIYHKLKKSVENITNRDFSLKQLGQILRVYPSSYILTPVKIVINFAKVESFLIEIPKELEVKESNKAAIESKIKINNENILNNNTNHLDLIQDSHVNKNIRNIQQRKEKFKELLADVVFESHQEFIKALGYDQDENKKKTKSELRAFHPKFDVERDVKEIEPILIQTKIPINNINSVNTSTLLKKRTSDSPELTKNDNESIKEMGDADVGKNKSESNSNEQLKPLSKYDALLKRIQEKEKKAIEKAMFTPVKCKDTVHEDALVSRFPEMARCIYFYFLSSGKTGIVIGEVIQAMMNSHKIGITRDDALKTIKMIAETCPKWLSIIRLADGRDVVKLDRKLEMKVVMESIKERLQRI
ncbi:replication licensing factor Cdt1 [Lobulomyces angularis]|nr:replication licensing factor Cdt1 [Lobulomyces angularis]